MRPLWKMVQRFLKKLKVYLPCNTVIPLLGMHSDRNIIQKDTCTPAFMAALFTIAKTWKPHESPLIDEWMKKVWYIYM